MTVEGVPNDVDEEVYDGVGDGPFVARVASDGDWRANADADQTGQLDISGKTKTPRAFRTPETAKHETRTIPRLVPFLRGQSSKKFAAQTSCGKQDSGHSAKVQARLHVHTYCD